MADVARLAGVIGRGASPGRGRTAARARLALDLIGVQQVRDGLFPCGDVVVADYLFFSGFVFPTLRNGSHFSIRGVVAAVNDLLRVFNLFVFVEARSAGLGRTAAVLLVMPATVVPAVRFARGALGGDIAGGGATRRFGSRLDVLGKVNFRSGGIVPVSPGDRPC